jgi:hypothetical protein
MKRRVQASQFEKKQRLLKEAEGKRYRRLIKMG